MTGLDVQAAVTANALERRYGSVFALSGLSLEIPRGQTAAIFGSNGAGKTTLLKILAGLCTPSSGSVEILGQRLPTSATLRRRIGMLAHECWLYADLSARENLNYYAGLYGLGNDSNDRVSSMLSRVGLEQVSQRPVRTYSRGMLQRLSLARAVLHRPELLLLDEPFTGLDPDGAASLTTMLDELKDEGTTMVLASHDFTRALAVSDLAFVLHRGRVAWSSGTSLPTADEMTSVYSEAVKNGIR